MGKLIYAANTSLDGHLEDATGGFDGRRFADGAVHVRHAVRKPA